MIQNGICLNCLKSVPLPHELYGQLTVGTITPNTNAIIMVNPGGGLPPKKYPVISDGSGLLIVEIPEADACWFMSFNQCCYKLTVLVDGQPVNFTTPEANCVTVCFEIDCGNQEGPHVLSVFPDPECIEVDNNCDPCAQ